MAVVPSLLHVQYLSDFVDEEEEEEGAHPGPSHRPAGRSDGRKRKASARKGENSESEGERREGRG